jgi:ATP-binding cassette subfamily B protein
MIYGLIPLVSAVVMLAGMIYITARIDGQVVLVALSATPLLFLFTHVFGKRLKDRWTDLKMMESSANSQVQEVISSMRVVKAFGREEHEHERFIIQSNEKMRMQIRTYLLQGGYDLLIGVSMSTATAAVLLLGGLHVLSGKLSLGDLLLMMGYVAQLLEPLKLLSKKLTELQAGLASAERAFALQDEIPDVVEKADATPIEKAAGEVSFRNVTFAYTKGNSVLSGISLDVPAGARVGIQGRTGSGKSTLLGLLVRFYDVDDGQILVDGIDIRDYKLDELRNQFGIVLQEPLLFSTSIAENIAYGKIGAPMEEIVDAAKLANAHDFIAALPAGYDTKVGERGVQLSGGERQRISLARAFLKDAPILILDEPTSSVDTATEGLIMDAMERLMRGRTTFMIAHRIATLKDCDLRIEMRDGHLVEVIPELRDADRVGVI